MAKNYVQPGEFIHAAPTDPETPTSGCALIVGTIAGVAVTLEAEGGNATGECTVVTKGVFNLPVVGNNGSSDAAVAVGDRVYYDTNINGLNVNSSAVLYGKTLGAVDEGATTTVPVKLIQA